MAVVQCVYCGTQVETERSTRKYCSKDCERKKRTGYPKSRECRHCRSPFEILGRGDANRWHCSKQCAKNRQTKAIRDWQKENLDAVREHSRRWIAKNPGYWVEKARRERRETLDFLGGACVVCGVDNQFWLHVDYIPTTRDLRYRHPRNISFIRRNAEDFRILCANHHYELTLTGRIEGTSITQ